MSDVDVFKPAGRVLSCIAPLSESELSHSLLVYTTLTYELEFANETHLF